MKIRILGFTAFLAISHLTSIQAVKAQDLVCAEIMPCGDAGQVLAPYNQGPCREVYERQCAAQAANQVSGDLERCMDKGDKLEIENARLKRALRVKRRK